MQTDGFSPAAAPNAAAQTPAAKSGHRPMPQGMPKWLQYAIAAAALITPLYTAVPQWIKAVSAWRADVEVLDVERAHELAAFFAENGDCTIQDPDWTLTDRGLPISSTVCKKGDVYVRIDLGSDGVYHDAIFIAEILDRLAASGGTNRRAEAPEAAPQTIDGIELAGLGHAAWDAVASTVAAGPVLADGGQTTSQASTELRRVQCQRVEGRYVIQRVKDNDQCFEERIDLYKRLTVGQRPVSCQNLCAGF